ncbi:hypothetical protein BJ741DRAFT_607382 [Chytriomyces cf. hyalinus JEL632]|nr:hypothetical protein BJ741DRAFT_607382 [Chytriomyces cf. hyalinus JEL632]
MSSGFGTSGGRGRCFSFFQDYAGCFAQADNPRECLRQYEDYQECLYHRKEILRLKMVEAEWSRQNKAAEKAAGGAGLLSFLPGFAK